MDKKPSKAFLIPRWYIAIMWRPGVPQIDLTEAEALELLELLTFLHQHRPVNEARLQVVGHFLEVRREG
jgi:hypothetical protein